MKKILSILTIVMLAAVSAIAQSPSPGIFNYQGVARNSVGNVLINKTITLRLTIHDGAAAGPTVYQESRTTVTNPFGLFNVQVGSAGATNVTGTIAGVLWGVNTKFIQVEIDPNGGTTFINIGTAQLASVPYSLYSSLSNDLVLPFSKTQNNAGTLFSVTNSGTGIAGSFSSTSGYALTTGSGNVGIGTATPLAKLDVSSGASFLNTSLVGSSNVGTWLSIGNTDPGGRWFNIVNTATANGEGPGKLIFFKGAAANNPTGQIMTFDHSTSNVGVGTNTPLGKLEVSSGASFLNTNLVGSSNVGTWLSLGNTDPGGRWFNIVNTATANGEGPGKLIFFKGAAANNPTGQIMTFDHSTSNVGIGTNNPTQRFHVAGTVRIEDGTQANNFILRSDATGTSNWADPALLLPGSFLWTRTGTNTWATNLGDNVGVGTNAPTYKLDVEHAGANGIHIRSTAAFSVVDLDAANGDAALRYQQAGTTRWNVRNAPGSNDYQIVRNNSLPANVTINNGTGFVGIIQTAPAYQLDVLHTGSTGIRSQSISSFSVVDIDAASGDAALRFANAGVYQWNIRNQPGTDNFQIFEFGGGGERMHIENATGNVSVGGVAPIYRLDVQHDGSTGIRSKSTSSYSVVDIDAQDGDAALRFFKNGVGSPEFRWVVRNNPGNDNFQIFGNNGMTVFQEIDYNTGNVSFGDVPSSYKVDAVHGGATGIRSKSTNSFSVVDIDAQNGDAALRFFKNGVGSPEFRWVVRNNPGDDNFQIFGNNGMTVFQEIDYNTGNVSFGDVPSSYKVDAVHGGATGIRSKSTSSYSVVDIDAQNGDAALRFFKNGVAPANFRWVTRNNPGNDNYEIIGNNGAVLFQDINYTTGKVTVYNDFTALGVKLFTMDHPLDPTNKTLMHAAAESNEVINFYSGNIRTDASGKAVVQLPDYFEAINKDSRYQLTVLESPAGAYISKKVQNNRFEITSSLPNVEVSWEVKGVRNDARMQKHPFVAVQNKAANEKGKYVDPEAHNQPLSKGVHYNPDSETSLKAGYKPTVTKVAAVVTGPSSLDPIPVQNITEKPVYNSGSVSHQPKEKKAEVKPVEVMGTSVEDVKKTPSPEKKASKDPGSTKD